MHITKPKKLIGRLQSPKQLDGDLWCITCYFNPLNYTSRLTNFINFYARILEQCANIKVIEAAIGSAKFVLQDIVDNDNLIQVECGPNILWQKERLLNILLDELPGSCDKVCWIDCDILIQNQDWQTKISESLNLYKCVQGFVWCANLPKGVSYIDEIDIECFPVKHGDCARVYSYIAGLLQRKTKTGHPGFMWAARREILDRFKLYDKNIVGGGDWMISRAATWQHYSEKLVQRYSKFHIADFLKWGQPFCEEIDFSFNFVPNIIFHQYHGKISNRGYIDRLKYMKKQEYNPQTDIETINNLYALTQEGQRLKNYIYNYFNNRREDI